MNHEQRNELRGILRKLAGYAERITAIQECEEVELNDLSSECADAVEQLEENVAILDEAAFFVQEAIKNLKEIPGIEG